MSVLVAGIGNVFLGDDAFGVEVVQRLARGPLPEWVRVVDFGIRGYDLAYALMAREHEGAVLVDLLPAGEAPGTLRVIEPELDPDAPVELDAHGMEPVKVLALVRALGGEPGVIRVVGCESERRDGDEDDMALGLSARVAAAVEPAMQLVLDVAASLRAERPRHA